MAYEMTILFFVLLFTFVLYIVYLIIPKSKCKKCGSTVFLEYVGYEYSFEYDGRCKKCNAVCLRHREDLL